MTMMHMGSSSAAVDDLKVAPLGDLSDLDSSEDSPKSSEDSPKATTLAKGDKVQVVRLATSTVVADAEVASVNPDYTMKHNGKTYKVGW
jgi:hypothetical protein